MTSVSSSVSARCPSRHSRQILTAKNTKNSKRRTYDVSSLRSLPSLWFNSFYLRLIRSALPSVRIAQFREAFFSVLSASQRATREKGQLVAACRAGPFEPFCGKSTQVPFHEPFTPDHLASPVRANRANQAKSCYFHIPGSQLNEGQSGRIKANRAIFSNQHTDEQSTNTGGRTHGVLERWSNAGNNSPHHSTTPSLHHSITPPLQSDTCRLTFA
jgi:hypothetical protein